MAVSAGSFHQKLLTGRFIYEIGWDQRVARRQLDRYLAGEASAFDNRLLLKPGVGRHLRQLNGLLRPLIQRRWAAMVAQLNRLEESQLEVFLFGADRAQTTKVRAGLWELQDRRCFYCDTRVSDPARAHVDHFVPWSRYPDDGKEFVAPDPVAIATALAASHGVRSSNGSSAETV